MCVLAVGARRGSEMSKENTAMDSSSYREKYGTRKFAAFSLQPLRDADR